MMGSLNSELILKCEPARRLLSGGEPGAPRRRNRPLPERERMKWRFFYTSDLRFFDYHLPAAMV